MSKEKIEYREYCRDDVWNTSGDTRTCYCSKQLQCQQKLWILDHRVFGHIIVDSYNVGESCGYSIGYVRRSINE
ncbi:hypothetical protein AGMMS49990_09090 [Endomicrobiia bacterium]|nr:hypothetical protein AGMMS49990_09090 [Endomicrobiia bacterium]